MWKSEVTQGESVLSFHHEGPQRLNSGPEFGSKHLYLLSHLSFLSFLFLERLCSIVSFRVGIGVYVFILVFFFDLVIVLCWWCACRSQPGRGVTSLCPLFRNKWLNSGPETWQQVPFSVEPSAGSECSSYVL